MGRQVFRTTWKHRILGSGADEVIAVMPIPRGGKLTNVWGDVHLVSQTNPDRDKAASYGCHGFIIPDYVDSESLSVDTLWDNMVPKDLDIDVTAGARDVDVDPETPVGGPVEEPGEANLNRVFNVANDSVRFYNRERILTVASRGLSEPVVSSEVDLWMPNDHFKVRIKDQFRVENFSYAMIAVSQPSWDEVTTGNESTFDQTQTTMLENLEATMMMALPEILGLTETGAESPFSNFANMIKLLVEPQVEEETASAFTTLNYNVFSRFTFEIELGVEGTKGPISG